MPCTALGPAGGWKPGGSSAGALRRAVPVHACGRACTDAGGVRALSGAGVTGTRARAVAVLASGIIGPGRRMEARGRFYRESSGHVPGSINCWAPLTCVGSRLDRCMRRLISICRRHSPRVDPGFVYSPVLHSQIRRLFWPWVHKGKVLPWIFIGPFFSGEKQTRSPGINIVRVH